MSVDLNAGLYAWLKTVSAVTSLIGGSTAPRAWPVEVLETKDLPYIVFLVEGEPDDETHNAPATTANARVTFSCRAVTPLGASALATAVADAVRAFRHGLMGSVTVNWMLYRSTSPAYLWEQQEFAVDVECDCWYVL